MDLTELMKEGARSSSNSNSYHSRRLSTRSRKRSSTNSINRSKSKSITSNRSRTKTRTSLQTTSFHRSLIKPVQQKSVLKKTFNVLNQKKKLEISFEFTKKDIKNNKEAYNALKRCQDIKFLGRGAFGEVYRIDKNLVIKLSGKDNSDEAKSLRSVNKYEERNNFNECGKFKPRVLPKQSCCDKKTKKIKLGEQMNSFRYCSNGRYFPEIFFNGKDTKHSMPYWIIMGNVGNQTLDKYIQNNKVTYTDVLDIFKQICEAIHILHKNKLFHGDLKLDNIMIGKNNQIVIIDLQCSYDNAINNKLCKTIATPLYMSPYKANGCSGIKPESCQYRSDIWTISIILYKILTGEFLTSGNNILNLIYKYGVVMVKNKLLVENKDDKLFNNVLNKFCKLKIKTTQEQKTKLIALLQKLFDYKEEEKPEHIDVKKESYEGFDTIKHVLEYFGDNFNHDLTIPVSLPVV